jgi:alanyl-tRNA synthetase
LQEQLKKVQDQLRKAAAADLAATLDRLVDEAPTVHGAKVIASQLPVGTPAEVVREQMDRLRKKAGSAFVVLGWSDEEGKVSLVAALTADLVKKGLKAGDVVKQVAAVVGGSGGGKPDFAQAGGKDAGKLPEAIAKAADLARQLLGG